MKLRNIVIADVSAALFLVMAGTADMSATSPDRLDFIATDGSMSSVLADDVDDITFPKILNRFSKFRIKLKDGTFKSFLFSNMSDVRFSSAERETKFPVSYKHDYNMELDGVSSGAWGDIIHFESSHWYIPTALHIYGDYTGRDYSLNPDFIHAVAEPDCYCPATYAFEMPYEPVTLVAREWVPTLYNGIAMPEVWPPKMNHGSFAPMPVPYLDNIPDVINVTVGRQLFIDDFLIESTNLDRVFHKPRKYEGNPILRPTDTEHTSKAPGAMPKDGGIWWEPREGVYKMWYEAGWYGKMALATSVDGINWTRPDLGKGSNILQSISDIRCNSSAVVLDYDAPDQERYKLFMRSPNATATDCRGWALTSSDGIEWTNRTPTGLCGDKSTMFYNPFRRKWVYSIRSVDLGSEPYGRARYYREHSDFLVGADWEEEDASFWCQADYDDEPDAEFNLQPQLYNLDAVAYESVMISMHQILMDGKTVSGSDGLPKITELKVGFSRDGFHWHRPFREVFIGADRTSDDSWERGYIQPVGGICGVYGDELRFYYIGFSKIEDGFTTSTGCTGVAIMRRDGFASMETSEDGTLLTRQIKSATPWNLFVNADCSAGELRAEIIDAEGNVMPGFSLEDCVAMQTDSTIARIMWKNAPDTQPLASVIEPETPFRIRFKLRNGKLYSFWLSGSADGESYGYVGAGGPGYTSNVDNQGIKAYEALNGATK